MWHLWYSAEKYRAFVINFSIFDNEKYQRDSCIKSDIWSDVILLVCITLFCDQGHKSESLDERRKIM